jgi:hypothetical protein
MKHIHSVEPPGKPQRKTKNSLKQVPRKTGTVMTSVSSARAEDNAAFGYDGFPFLASGYGPN